MNTYFRKLGRGLEIPFACAVAVIGLTPTVFPGCAEADRVRILVIGDSFSVKGAEFVGGNATGFSFSDQVETELGEDYEIVNVACPGSSAIDWSRSTPGMLCPPAPWTEFPKGLLRERALPELPVDTATVLLGTNDAIRMFEPVPVTAEAYDKAIGELTDALLEGGANRILLMIPPDLRTIDAHRRVQAYREKIFERCESSDRIICGPDFFMTLDLDRDFTNAELHPNARGHTQMAKALAEAIRKIHEPASPIVSLPTAVALVAFVAVFVWGIRRSKFFSSTTPGD